MSGECLGNLQERAPTRPMRNTLPTAVVEATMMDNTRAAILCFLLESRMGKMSGHEKCQGSLTTIYLKNISFLV